MDPRRTPSIGEAALALAGDGWRVFPLHSVVDGRCSCGDADCVPGKGSPGKHPRTPHGFKDATSDTRVIEDWWRRWPDANIGIATGDGVLVIDVDPRNGGDASLAELEEQHALPPSRIVLTGGGGRHLFFKYPDGVTRIPCSSGQLAPGLDVKGDGGYVVAPPSNHASGARYVWSDSSVSLAPLPRWLAERLVAAGRAKSTVATPGETLTEGRRNDGLFRLACSLRTKAAAPKTIEAALIQENLSRCDPPLTEAEVREIVGSASRYPAGAGRRSESGAEVGAEVAVAPWPGLAPEALHGLAGEIVRLVEPHSEADPVALLVQLLAAFGSVIGRGPNFRVEDDRHFPNIFVALVGATSKGRKGTSWGRIASLFGRVDAGWSNNIANGMSSGEGLIWQVRDPIEKQECIKDRKTKEKRYESRITDAGVADKRLLVQESELARVLRAMERDSNTLSAVIRQAWDTGTLRTLVKESPATATGAHVAIVAHITQDELRRRLADTEIANGFANRFLWVAVKRSKVLPEGGFDTDADRAAFDARLAECAARVARAVQFARSVLEVKRDEIARADWKQMYARLSAGRPGLAGAVTSRAEAQVVRLSLIYALLDGSDTIRAEHQKAAVALWRYAEESAVRIFGDRLGDPMADTILRELRASSAGLSRTDIRDLLGRHANATKIAAALGSLQEMGLARPMTVSTGGRPEERWFVEATEATKATEPPAATPSVALVASVAVSAQERDGSPEHALPVEGASEEVRW